jgi:hypothetical protein
MSSAEMHGFTDLEEHVEEVASVDRDHVGKILRRRRPGERLRKRRLEVVHADVHPHRAELADVALVDEVADVPIVRSDAALEAYHVAHPRGLCLFPYVGRGLCPLPAATRSRRPCRRRCCRMPT